MRRVAAVRGLLILALAGCDRMATPPAKQKLRDAETKVAEGDYEQAATLYEEAFDDGSLADMHYKLGLLYDDKIGEPLSAIHHFKRYLILAPNGSHALDVKSFIKRDEVSLLTSLSGDSIVTRAEASRLRNENLSLQKQLAEARAKTAPSATAAPRAKKTRTKGTH